MSDLEKKILYNAILQWISHPSNESMEIPLHLLKYINDNIKKDDPIRQKISDAITKHLVKVYSECFRIEFNNFIENKPYDVFENILLVSKEFGLYTIESFYDNIYVKYLIDPSKIVLKHKVKHPKPSKDIDFITYLNWYNLAKAIDFRYWYKKPNSIGQDFLVFDSYAINNINGMLDKVYYNVAEYLENPNIQGSVPEIDPYFLS